MPRDEVRQSPQRMTAANMFFNHYWKSIPVAGSLKKNPSLAEKPWKRLEPFLLWLLFWGPGTLLRQKLLPPTSPRMSCLEMLGALTTSCWAPRLGAWEAAAAIHRPFPNPRPFGCCMATQCDHGSSLHVSENWGPWKPLNLKIIVS